MPDATFTQTNFNGGEWSPLAQGRIDIAKYKNGLATCLNYLPTQQGGLTRRPGTRFIAAVKDSTYAPRLEKFEFSATQSYQLEFGAGYIRFYVNDGQLQTSGVAAYNAGTAYNIGDLVTNGGVTYYCIAATTGNAPPNATYWYAQTGTIYEIPTPYSSTDIWNLSLRQKADVMYIALPTQPVYKLQRKGATTWVLSQVSFLDGPYIPVNTTGTTMQVGGTSGSVSLTASGTIGVNGGVGFRSQDVGRSFRIRLAQSFDNTLFSGSGLFSNSPLAPKKFAPSWIWGTITAVTDSTHATINLVVNNNSPLPSPAKAVANVTNGAVDGITVTDGGAGYNNQIPNVVVVPHGGTPASITVNIGVLGTISSLNLVSGGSGYTPSTTPSLKFTGSGSGASGYATVNASGVVTSVTLTNGGGGYNASTTTVYVLGGGSAGSGATGKAVVSVDGHVLSVTVTNGGSGYTGGADVYLDPPIAINTSPSTFWQLGLMNSVDGYAGVVGLHQDRLILTGYSSYPNRVDGSNVGDYENFAPTEVDGTVTDSDAYSFNLSAGPINAAQWAASDENGLIIGTNGNEWVVSPSNAQQAITPTNVNARLISNYGSTSIPSIRVGKATLFVQRTKRKLRELFFQFYGNTFTAQDISLVGEHLTASGFKQMALQLAPQQVIWFSRIDGKLVALTYDKDQEVLGWHQHQLGGYSDAAQTLPPLIESVSTNPAASALRDELWLVVNRYINGATIRSVELMTKTWEDGDDPKRAPFLDMSAEYNGAPTTTVSGLTWLKGQTVGVLADGSVHADVVVSNTGTITLTRSASVIQVGLRYTSQGKLLRIEAGGAEGAAQGKYKKVARIIFRFFQSGFPQLYSASGGQFYQESNRDSSMRMDNPIPLFTGDVRWNYDGTWDSDGQITWQTLDPLPSNITLIAVQLTTQDGR